MANQTKKFTVLKPVLLGGKVQPKGTVVELEESASTKALLATKHIETPAAAAPETKKEEMKK